MSLLLSLPPLLRNVEEGGVGNEEGVGPAGETEVEVEVEVEEEELRGSLCSSRKIRISRSKFNTISSTSLASSVDESRFRAICATLAISSLFDFICKKK